MNKIISILIVLIIQQQILSMEPIESRELIKSCNTPFFKVCERGNLSQVKDIFLLHPEFNVNYKNEKGNTVLLVAAKKDKYDIVDYLLMHGADKSVKNNENYSLFSEIIYKKNRVSTKFTILLKYYNPNEFNRECNNMPMTRGLCKCNKNVQKVLNGTLEINSPIDESGDTALHKTFYLSQVPDIIELLNREALLIIKNNQGEIPYDKIKNDEFIYNNNILPFILREAFNNNSNFATLFVYCCLQNSNTFFQNLCPDIIDYIKKIYFELISENFLSLPEAYLWRYVCSRACELANIENTDSDLGLIRILLLSQEAKTDLNMKLALEDL